MNKKISILLAVMLIASGIGIAYAGDTATLGTSVEITPAPTPVIISISVTPTSIDFGKLGAGDTSSIQTANIAITGAEALVTVTPNAMTGKSTINTIDASNIHLGTPSPLDIIDGGNVNEEFTLIVPNTQSPDVYTGDIGFVATAK